MTPFWVLQTEKVPASAVLTEDELILENRYIRRVLDRTTGHTVSLTDGDGTEAIVHPMREGAVSVDGTEYILENPSAIRIREGSLTEKKFEYMSTAKG